MAAVGPAQVVAGVDRPTADRADPAERVPAVGADLAARAAALAAGPRGAVHPDPQGATGAVLAAVLLREKFWPQNRHDESHHHCLLFFVFCFMFFDDVDVVIP